MLREAALVGRTPCALAQPIPGKQSVRDSTGKAHLGARPLGLLLVCALRALFLVWL